MRNDDGQVGNLGAQVETTAERVEPTTRTCINRYPARGDYDRTTIETILDEAMVCHVGFVVDGQPYVIPTIHARDGARLYLHGSPMSRMLRAAAAGTAHAAARKVLPPAVGSFSVQLGTDFPSPVVRGL